MEEPPSGINTGFSIICRRKDRQHRLQTRHGTLPKRLRRNGLFHPNGAGRRNPNHRLTPSTPSSHRPTPRSPPRRGMTTGAKYKTRSGSKPPNCGKATACWAMTNAGTPCTASASRKNRSRPTT